MKPALIVCEASIGALKIASLSLLDRLVVSLHRGGCSSVTIVCAESLPPLKRTQALGIAVRLLRQIPIITEPTVIAACNLLVQPGDIKRIVQRQGRLVNQSGEPLSLGLVASFSGDLPGSLKDLEKVPAEGVAEPVQDAVSARKAEQILWQSLTSQSDGIVDKHFNRPVGRILSKVLIHAPVTPNQVSIASMLIGLWAAYYLARGEYMAGIIGAIWFQVSAIVDCIDGDIARVIFKESRVGKWLDISADQVVHLAIFGAIAMGMAERDTGSPAYFLGASAIVGGLISFAVVLRGMFLPADRRSTKLQKLIDSATSRDFSVLVLLLAVFGKLDWFLWITAIGVHVFWITALLLQLPRNRQAAFELITKR
jgi:phosphatidylglycerophosphate synthase